MMRRRFLQGLAAMLAFPVVKTKAAIPIPPLEPVPIPIEITKPFLLKGQIMMVMDDWSEDQLFYPIKWKIWTGEEWIRWEDHPDSP